MSIPSADWLKNPKFLLSLILIAFFTKGAFLSALQPIFTGQDEARHYNSVQLIAEKDNPSLQQSATPATGEQNKDDLSTYRFSEEIRETARATDNRLLRADEFNTIRFSDTSFGQEESTIDSHPWSTSNYRDSKYGPDAVQGSKTLYHKLAAIIESSFADESILVRFHLIRLFSVLLGTTAVFLAYLTARTIGFSATTSLIATALIAFQPKFTLYLTNINYDALLIPLFFFFTYAGARVIRDRFTLPNIFLLIAAIIPALFTKATGYLLIPLTFLLFLPYLWQVFQQVESKRLRSAILLLTTTFFTGVLSFLYIHFFGAETPFLQKLSTLTTYLSKTISFEKVFWPSETYWGMIGWTKSWAIQYATSFIFIVELIATIGLLLVLFSRRFKENYPSFLPAKKQLLFLVFMVLILQAGVRFADWNTYIRIGGMSLSLGTPGRYFLPTLLAHILLLVSGLSAFLTYFKKDSYFHSLLTALLILMIALMFHLTLNVITLRYYF